MTLRRTALTETHRAAGAKMADFGGWEMPIEYPTGVVAEHTAVRTAVGVFDVSHMGKLVVSGPGASAALNRILANDLDRIGAGQAQYSMLCTDQGGVVDDLIVYLLGDDEVRIVPNAANAAKVRDALAAGLPEGVTLTDLHEAEGILAIQGPGSRDVMLDLGLLAAGDDLPYMAFTTAEFAGTPAVVCRTGYTGEHGYEVIIGVEALPALWAQVAERATPCGLGARDTLRTEMGYPLHGQDLVHLDHAGRGGTVVGRRLGQAGVRGARCPRRAACRGPARVPCGGCCWRAGACRARTWPCSAPTGPRPARPPPARSPRR